MVSLFEGQTNSKGETEVGGEGVLLYGMILEPNTTSNNQSA